MSIYRNIEEKLRGSGRVLLDGATGTELERRGVPMHGLAWTAEAVLTKPEVVRAVHRDYIKAGVEVITVNSFSLARHMLLPAGLGERCAELNEIAVQLALLARDETGAKVAVAGSVAPTCFCAEPSEGYLHHDQALAGYRLQAEALRRAGVDLLMVEMIGDIQQGSLAVQAACDTGLPVWLGFSCRRDHGGRLMLWDRGDFLADGVRAMAAIGGSAAFIMHTEVADAAEAFTELCNVWTGPLGIYAHSGVFVMPHWKFNDVISPEDYAAEAGSWLAMGARIIGGCCGIGPEHIRELKRRYFI
jgi:S-methylmethionine-dependent homocysteine/selenocysteine methylase